MNVRETGMKKVGVLVFAVGGLLVFIGCGGTGDNGLNSGYTSGDANGFSRQTPDGQTGGQMGTVTTTGGALMADRVYFQSGSVISSAKPDGTDVKKYIGLTNGIGALAVDPTGKIYAFAGGTAGIDKTTYDVYLGSSVDEKDAKQLTQTGFQGIGAIEFSPDGKTVFFTAQSKDGKSRLYSLGTDGKDLKTIDVADDFDLDSTGTKLLYTRYDDTVGQIFWRKVSGGDATQLTNDPYDHFQPRWSPDGSQIAFSAKVQGNYHVFVMDAKGEHSKQVTVDTDNEFSPAFSPDGTELAFVRHATDGTRAGVFRIKVGGTDQKSIVLQQNLAPMVSWSVGVPDKDGKKTLAAAYFGGSLARGRFTAS